MAHRYWLLRSRRHLFFAAVAAAATGLVYLLTPPPDLRHRLSMGTAYAGLLFLAISLLLGPWNVLRRRPNPISFDLRRDAGIWAGILALLHTAIGLTVHLRGRMWMYFLSSLHPLRPQATLFGLANYLGLVSALVFLLLLAISNDRSLKSLGIQRWKSLQRSTYAAAALAILHGALFQATEKRHLAWVLVLAATTALTLILQGIAAASLRTRNQSGSLQQRQHG